LKTEQKIGDWLFQESTSKISASNFEQKGSEFEAEISLLGS
jgi:hypothetical protein